VRGFGKHTVESYMLDHAPVEKELEEEFSKLLDKLHPSRKPKIEEGPAKPHTDIERYLVFRGDVLFGIGCTGFDKEIAYLGGATVIDNRVYQELLGARVVDGIRRGYTNFQIDLKQAKNREIVESLLESLVLNEFEGVGDSKINPYSVMEIKSYTVLGYKIKYGKQSEILISLNTKTAEIPYSPRVGVNW